MYLEKETFLFYKLQKLEGFIQTIYWSAYFEPLPTPPPPTPVTNRRGEGGIEISKYLMGGGVEKRNILMGW